MAEDSPNSSKLRYKRKFPLHEAASQGKLSEVISIIQRDGHDINSQDNNLYTALHLSSHKRHVQIVSWLMKYEVIENGVSVRPIIPDTKEMYHRTPLHLSIGNQDENVSSILIDECKDDATRKKLLNATDIRGQTALFVACRKGYVKMVQLLLKKGADPNILDERMMSPLYFLCSPKAKKDKRKSYDHNEVKQAGNLSEHQIKDCLNLLIQYGANPNKQCLNKMTPLHICAAYNKIEYLKILQKSKTKCDFTLQNDEGATPFQCAIKDKHTKIAEVIAPLYRAQLEQKIKKKGVQNMSEEDVIEWIQSIGYGQYRKNFIDNHINGKALSLLDIDSLKNDLGITPFGHRTSIIQLRDELKQMSLFDGAIDKDSLKLNEIDFKDVTIGERIGSGFFGEVRRGKWNGTDVAIKSFFREEDKRKALEREMPIIAKLRHPNIITFFGVMKNDKNDIMLITELMSANTLYFNIKNNYDTIKRVREKIALDVAKGMRHMHTCNFLHRDLNTKNILLNDTYTAKISDFGLSRIMDDNKDMTSNVGFIVYMAPEIREGHDYTEKADVYSFGMVLYELFTGKEPHHEYVNENLLHFSRLVSVEGYRPPIPDNDEIKSWKNLIVECWDHNPEKRPSFATAYERIERIRNETPIKIISVDDSMNAYYT